MNSRWSRALAGLLVAISLVMPVVLPTHAAPKNTKKKSAPARPPATRSKPRPKPPAAAPQTEEELQRLKQAAEEKRRLARELKGKEQGVLSQLRKSDEALSATRRYIQELESREQGLDGEIELHERALGLAGQELERRRDRLSGWMREAYKHGRTRNLEIFFSSASFSDLLKRTYFLSLVMQEQRRLMTAVREQREVVQEEKSELEASQRHVAALRDEKEGERTRYQTLKKSQSAEVGRIRGQRKSYEAAARELEAAASRLQKLLADMEEKRKRRLREGQDQLSIELDRNNFGANRGRLPWPAQGEVIGRFGLETHPEWGTQIRNNGLDIRADEGSPVRCVGDGAVELVDWLPGYGQSVIVNHGQGFYSVYAHLGSTSVSADGRVSAGQTIGTVGDSGSLKGVCLHFEIRRGREAQNPESWLR